MRSFKMLRILVCESKEECGRMRNNKLWMISSYNVE